jgi:hypothetical protein
MSSMAAARFPHKQVCLVGALAFALSRVYIMLTPSVGRPGRADHSGWRFESSRAHQ